LGVSYLAALAAEPLKECIESIREVSCQRIALLIGAEESDLLSIGPQHSNDLLRAVESTLQVSFNEHSQVLPYGDVSIAFALSSAAALLSRRAVDYCIIGGVQTYLIRERLLALEKCGRLKTGRNSDGLIPGEAACFIGVTLLNGAGTKYYSHPYTVIKGMGFEQEGAVHSDEPNRGRAWTSAMRAALVQAKIHSRDVCFRLSNHTGERALFLESSFATMRIYLEQMPLPPGWYPAGSVGSVGAGVGALLLGWAMTAFYRRYAPGPVAFCELASESGGRAALVITSH
jgi:3-oxoacyl-[acyl-carrier-protein] synthase-1